MSHPPSERAVPPGLGTGLAVICTTLPDQILAVTLARESVERGLVACAQAESAATVSVYRWQGQVCEDREWRLTFKTTLEREPELRAWMATRHPYDLPQWVVLPGLAGEAYGEWVAAATRTAPSGDAR